MAENNDVGDAKQLIEKLINTQKNKRSLENPTNVESTKKPRVTTRIEDLSMQLKEIKGLSRKKLEEFCLQVYCKVIDGRSNLKELTRLSKERDQEITAMQKNLNDLESYVNKLTIVQDNVSKTLQTSPNRRETVSVYKICQNVGVQVNAGKMKCKGTKTGANSSFPLNTVPEIIDLTDENTANKPVPSTSTSTADGGEQMVVPYQLNKNNDQQLLSTVSNEHPAPLPISPISNIPLAPILQLTINLISGKVIISWDVLGKHSSLHEKIVKYQLYWYKETSDPPSAANWCKMHEFVALPLPMTCYLYKCNVGKYHFAVRGMDAQSRVVAFSSPAPIIFENAFNMMQVAPKA